MMGFIMTFSYLNMFGSVSPLHCLLLSPPTLTDHLPIPEDPSYFLSYLYLCPCVCVCVPADLLRVVTGLHVVAGYMGEGLITE